MDAVRELPLFDYHLILEDITIANNNADYDPFNGAPRVKKGTSK